MPGATTSNYLYDKQMEYLLRGTLWTPPTSLYLALFTVKPDLDGTGGVEVSTTNTNYARVQIPGATGWNGPSSSPNREFVNLAEIIFQVPSANWGNIVAAGLFDAEVLGNLLYTAELTTPKVVQLGDGAPKILAGQLRISRAWC